MKDKKNPYEIVLDAMRIAEEDQELVRFLFLVSLERDIETEKIKISINSNMHNISLIKDVSGKFEGYDESISLLTAIKNLISIQLEQIEKESKELH